MTTGREETKRVERGTCYAITGERKHQPPVDLLTTYIYDVQVLVFAIVSSGNSINDAQLGLVVHYCGTEMAATGGLE